MATAVDYDTYRASKLQNDEYAGFEPLWLPDFLFDFQRALTDWAIRKGRSALMEDCGLGKSVQELVWAENVVRHTNRPVLIMAPLAVAAQTVREGEKFGIECQRSHNGKVHPGINIINYEQLHKYDAADFAGAVCDESSILKSFSGVRCGEITEWMRRLQYRLLGTATAAPNDYIELGTSSEALGYLGHMDMLNQFFKNDQNNSALRGMYGEAPKWRFRGYAEQRFWQWVCSWARAIRRPEDLGFDGSAFVLPKLIKQEHLIEIDEAPPGMLFSVPAVKMDDQRAECKRTIRQRCEKAAALALANPEQTMLWCHLNDEGDTLTEMIPGAVQISGRDSDGAKEEKFLAFIDGQINKLVTKDKIGAWGLNLQQCNHTVRFPSHSFESFYQAVRRFWRFGQERDVTCDIVLTEGELRVMANLQRKADAAAVMFDNLCREMQSALEIKRLDRFQMKEEVPSWL